MDIYLSTEFFVFALIQAVLFLLLIRFLDLYEREPLALIVLVVAFAVSYLVAWHFGNLQFYGLTDGIVYGAAVGLGFSFAEDIFYFFKFAAEGSLGEGLNVYLERVDFFGVGSLGHAVYTGTFGAGLGLATRSRSWILKGLFPLHGPGAHARDPQRDGPAHPGPALRLGRHRRCTRRPAVTYKPDPATLLSGELERWRVLRRVRNELVDLAFLKRRLRRTGDWGRVERLRRRIRGFKSQEIVE